MAVVCFVLVSFIILAFLMVMMVMMVMMDLMAVQALYMFRRLQASLIVLLAIFSVRAQTKLLMLFYDAFVHVVCCQL